MDVGAVGDTLKPKRLARGGKYFGKTIVLSLL